MPTTTSSRSWAKRPRSSPRSTRELRRMPERERRVAANEVLFGAVNEQLEALAEELPERDDTFSIVCECGNDDCTERIDIDAAAYRREKAEAAHFVVLPP